jgi:hypothetical protein
MLWHCAADNVGQEELEQMICLLEDARLQAAYLARMTEGIGCEISSDGFGYFRDPRAMYELLFLISGVALHVESMIMLGNEARAFKELKRGAA